jgi:HEAT repeat protein
MVKTKKHCGFSISVVYILILLSVICIVIGCSSKKDETNAEKSPPTKTDDKTPSADKDAQEPKPPTLPILPILPLPDANQTVKEINKPPEVKIPIDTLLNEFNRTSSGERKIELLRSLFDMAFDRDPCVIGIVQMAVAEKDANVALAGIELLQGYESPKVLPAVVNAMAYPNEEVRRTAVNILLDINDPKAGDLLATALSDESEDIRDAALDITRYKDKQIQFRVLETAISCPFSDTKEKSVFMLENIRDHRAVDILIEALRDEDAEFREKVSSAISMLLDKEFESYKEAKTWWEKNRDRYDEDLSLR